MGKQLNISSFFSDTEVSQLNDEANTAEQLGNLTKNQIELVLQKKLHKLFVPKKYSGLEQSIPDALPTLEASSYIDGSLGWSLTLIAGAGLFGAFMQPDFAKQFFYSKKPIITGSGFHGGKAKALKSAYSISGNWKYATAIDHATLITATCFVTENGKIKHTNKTPVTKAVAFYPDEINVRKTWKSVGLKATGSHAFNAEKVTIPVKRTFQITPEASHIDSPLYRYPFDAFANATLAISLLGIAGRFLDESEHILLAKNGVSKKESLPQLQQNMLEKSHQKFHQAREKLYEIVNLSWDKVQAQNSLNKQISKNVCEQSRRSSQQAITSVQHLYPFLGMSAVNPDTVINRC